MAENESSNSAKSSSGEYRRNIDRNRDIKVHILVSGLEGVRRVFLPSILGSILWSRAPEFPRGPYSNHFGCRILNRFTLARHFWSRTTHATGTNATSSIPVREIAITGSCAFRVDVLLPTDIDRLRLVDYLAEEVSSKKNRAILSSYGAGLGSASIICPVRRLYFLWRFVNFGAFFDNCITPIWEQG